MAHHGHLQVHGLLSYTDTQDRHEELIVHASTRSWRILKQKQTGPYSP